MKINTIEGNDNINILANASMNATLAALVKEEIISNQTRMLFLTEHFCVFVEKEGGFKDWLQRVFGKNATPRIVCCKTQAEP